jgi:hypothetical protein
MSLASGGLSAQSLCAGPDDATRPVLVLLMGMKFTRAEVTFVGAGGSTADPVDVERVSYEATVNAFDYSES